MDTELLESLLEARRRALWPVRERYEIEGSLIKGSGRSAFYLPMARSNLPFEVAKVGDGDPKAALGFVRQFGELGYWNQLQRRGLEESEQGEPMQFIWEQAKKVRGVLQVFQASQQGDPRALAEALTAAVPEPEGWNAFGIEARDGDNSTRTSLLISLSISEHLNAIRPIVLPSEEDENQLQLGYQWTALFQVIYWHLAKVVTENRQLGICKECVNVFERTDKRQQFCPAPQEFVLHPRSDSVARAQSRCALRYRARQLRTRSRG